MSGIALVVFATAHIGMGLSPDSVVYISVARNLATGNGFVLFDGTPLVSQPPLYPLLLAWVKKLLGFDPIQSIPFVNAIIYGGIIYISGITIEQRVKHNKVICFLGGLLIIFSIPYWQVVLMAWTEVLFILFVVVFIAGVESYLQKLDNSSFLLFAVAASLACLTRYIGVVITLTGLMIILFSGESKQPKKLAHSAVFVFITTIPLGVWIIRNYLLTNTLLGPRASSIYTLSQNLRFTSQILMSWFVPADIAKHHSAIIFISATIGYIVGISWLNSWNKIKQAVHQLLPITLFVVLYLGFLMLSSTVTAYDKIDNRLLSPVFMPLCIHICFILDEIIVSFKKRLPKLPWQGILVIGFVSLLSYPISELASQMINYEDGYGGYTSRAWQESKTILFLRSHNLPDPYPIYSNDPPALYVYTNLSSSRSPAKTYYNSNENKHKLLTLIHSWPEKPEAYLVWFNRSFSDYLYTVDELKSIANISMLYQFEDGAIYKVTQQ